MPSPTLSTRRGPGAACPWALAVLLLLGAPDAAASAQTTTLAWDEQVEFFPTDAYFDPERDRWLAPVHALVFQPQRDQAARHAQMQALAGALRLPLDSGRNAHFAERAQPFLVDHERDAHLVVTLAGQTAWN
ncbi:MAG TPA: hypothetical protein VFD43_13770 [Planctomycetota bacterium]|nr:hypothetical protein [Planctomycetota bacterium]